MLSFWNKATVFIHFMTANLGVPAMLFIHGGIMKEAIAKSNYPAKVLVQASLWVAVASQLLWLTSCSQPLNYWDLAKIPTESWNRKNKNLGCAHALVFPPLMKEEVDSEADRLSCGKNIPHETFTSLNASLPARFEDCFTLFVPIL